MDDVDVAAGYTNAYDIIAMPWNSGISCFLDRRALENNEAYVDYEIERPSRYDEPCHDPESRIDTEDSKQ